MNEWMNELDDDEWSSHAPTVPGDTAPSAPSKEEYLDPEAVRNFIENIKRYAYWDSKHVPST